MEENIQILIEDNDVGEPKSVYRLDSKEDAVRFFSDVSENWELGLRYKCFTGEVTAKEWADFQNSPDPDVELALDN